MGCSAMHANEPSILLYERAASLLAAHPTLNLALAVPVLYFTLRNAAQAIGYLLG